MKADHKPGQCRFRCNVRLYAVPLPGQSPRPVRLPRPRKHPKPAVDHSVKARAAVSALVIASLGGARTNFEHAAACREYSVKTAVGEAGNSVIAVCPVLGFRAHLHI